MTTSSNWTAHRIFTELMTTDRRRQVAAAFWRHGGAEDRAHAIYALAQAMRFREPALRGAPIEKRADWLLARMNDPRFLHFFETALVAYHTSGAKPLLIACLDQWGIPHNEGLIEIEDPAVPSAEAVEAAVTELGSQFSLPDLLLYLASAGLLMGPAWAEVCWPVVERHLSQHPEALLPASN